ncbi:NAD(P)H-dependent glycerol-3-phosphate dehydrogenase [Algicella marina]|uniref:Glycerol-3-phosphate dehydrogenase [NAD(P)+] n=1 Tax=Algicella marina TaxID=2683284 RepID=A0A6P1T4G4_9RHOB|nr:NAD(P)H-dependent glycerol-3-phosphate dehydrogenase [Algicella marina]QHQ36897.1 NAD(P)H-dependent glycerol-3-phosphate dehydrogenase [Algicella marina]
MTPVAVIGAGAYGTALAIAIAKTGRPVQLWARTTEQAEALANQRENSRRLPGVGLPPSVQPTGLIADIKANATLLLAIPAQATETFLRQCGDALPSAPVVLAAKGISLDDSRLQTEIASALLPERQFAVLSGPGFADEIARGFPTALTLAASDRHLVSTLQDSLSTPTLRLYTSTDILGVQLGGALKNVVALACGMCAGAGLGESARAALMTRGFAEMQRLAKAMGADPATLAGLSGLGDLALSSASQKSRNFAAGYRLGARAVAAEGQTVEGIATARATVTLASRHNVEMPIAAAVTKVLNGELDVAGAMQALLARPQREETA